MGNFRSFNSLRDHISQEIKAEKNSAEISKNLPKGTPVAHQGLFTIKKDRTWILKTIRIINQETEFQFDVYMSSNKMMREKKSKAK